MSAGPWRVTVTIESLDRKVVHELPVVTELTVTSEPEYDYNRYRPILTVGEVTGEDFTVKFHAHQRDADGVIRVTRVTDKAPVRVIEA